jgi:hypothetical protein
MKHADVRADCQGGIGKRKRISAGGGESERDPCRCGSGGNQPVEQARRVSDLEHAADDARHALVAVLMTESLEAASDRLSYAVLR